MTRIATIGDSFLGLPRYAHEHQVYRQLEQTLNSGQENKSHEVLNFSFTGFGTNNQLVYYQDHIRHFQPDIVVLFFTVSNDARNNSMMIEPLYGNANLHKPGFILDEEGQLRFKAPKGALTADLKNELIANKADVIAFLAESKTRKLSDTIPKLSRDKDQEYPLSFAQQRFWFLDRLEPGNPSLHIVRCHCNHRRKHPTCC